MEESCWEGIVVTRQTWRRYSNAFKIQPTVQMCGKPARSRQGQPLATQGQITALASLLWYPCTGFTDLAYL